MEIHGVLAIILSLFGLVTVLAAAVAVAKASFAKTQIEALRGDRDDLTARVNILEEENTRITKDLETEKAKVKVLEGITIGKDHLMEIERLIKAHDKAVLGYVTDIKRTIEGKVS